MQSRARNDFHSKSQIRRIIAQSLVHESQRESLENVKLELNLQDHTGKLEIEVYVWVF